MKYIWDNDTREFVPDTRDRMHYHQIMKDIEFKSSDGAIITSRSQWREHLKRTGTIEMGHSDLKAQRERYESRQSTEREKLKLAEKYNVRDVSDVPMTPENHYERTRLNAEMANRLDGRPTPDRKMLIKMTLDEARRLQRR